MLQLLLGLFGGISFASFYALLLGFRPVPGEIDHVMMLVGAITVHGAGLLWLNWFYQDHGLDWAGALDLRLRTLPGVIVAGLLMGVVGFVVCSQIGARMFQLLSAAELSPEPQPAVQALQSSVSFAWVVGFGLITVVAAPLVEESLFRGILFAWLHRAGFPRVAWIGTALLFGLSHANLQAFVPLTVFALMLTWLYVKTGSLLAPVIAHGAFNTINYVLTLHHGALAAHAS